MKTDYVKLAVTGLKVLAAIAGGVAVFAGISKIVSEGNNKKNNTERPQSKQNWETEENGIIEEVPQQASNPGYSETGQKIINGLRIGQAAISGTMNVIMGVATVANSINRIFDPNYYNSMLNDPSIGGGYFGNQMIPSYPVGDYPWNRREDPGLPMNTPIYRGKDNAGDDTYWIRRKGNIIEVW